MSHRKRRFETLEDRRLLSVVAQAPTSGPSTVAQIAPSTPPVASLSGVDATSGSSDDDSSDYSDEYANQAPPMAGATGDASRASGGYVYAAEDYNSYASAYTYGNSAHASTKSSSTYSPTGNPASDQPSNTLPTLPAGNANLGQGTTNDSFAVLLPNAGLTSAASNSPPVARSPMAESPSIASDDRALLGEPVALPVTENAETLMAPVAHSDSPSDWKTLSARTAAIAEWFARAEPLMPAAETGARAILVGSLGAAIASLEDRADAVFERFGDIGGDLTHAQVSRIGQWLILAGGACAAFEYARARYREGGACQAMGVWPTFYEPRLRRRWFDRRRTDR